jgi:phosphoribosyl 1,2-cyclic phosphodiesterase
MLKVRFWGTRGSIPVPGKDTTYFGGNTTCLEITSDSGSKIIVDAGTGIRPLGEKLCKEREASLIYLLITHIHWDHIMGFPFFAPAFDSACRILIDGFPTCMQGLRVPFDNKMGDGFFPVKFGDLKADIAYLDKLNRAPLEVDDLLIDSIPLQHPQGGFGFRFRCGEKKLVFITDNELTAETRAGRRPGDYVDFCSEADILIHDAQYTPLERAERNGWGHSDYAAAVQLADESSAGRLVLFHHDPSRTDSEVEALKEHSEKLAKEKKIDLLIDAATEGSELTL